MSAARLRANYEALREGIEEAGVRPLLRYCAKTNNEAGVLAVLARRGSHVLVSHTAEGQLALRCGFPPERVAYQRPVLGPEDARDAVAAGLGLVHCCRLGDLAAVEAAARASGRLTAVSLRLRGSSFGLLGSLSGRVGLTADETVDAAKRIAGSGALSLAALNGYVGTQQPSPAAFRPAMRALLGAVARIRAEVGLAVGEVNLGGGVPSPSVRRLGPTTVWSRLRDATTPSDSTAAVRTFASGLALAFRAESRRAGLDAPPILALEPGRSVVGNAAVLVTSVRAVEGRWLFLDASRNHLGESPLLFQRQILPVAAPRGGRRRYHLSGGTLTTLDLVDVWRRLPPMAAGDLLALADAGAYSISRASRYAGLAPAVYLAEEDGSARLVRRPEDVTDLAGPMGPGA